MPIFVKILISYYAKIIDSTIYELNDCVKSSGFWVTSNFVNRKPYEFH